MVLVRFCILSPPLFQYKYYTQNFIDNQERRESALPPRPIEVGVSVPHS